MKVISVDRTYIDYISGNLGVRVWRDQCQAIARDDEAALWIVQENVFSMPVPIRVFELPRSGATSVRALAWNVALYENKEFDPELRRLVRAWVTFDHAISAG